MSLLAAALEYARHGFRVFPLVPGNKQPLTAHGVKDATTDYTSIVLWWTQTPAANIGVATGGGRWVLDLDDYEARARLEAAGVVLPDDAPTATTGKGAHIWFAGDVGNRTKLVDKVDVRGEGGYVVAPPSIHPNGGTYQWVGEPPFSRPLPVPPPSLLAMVGGKAKSAAAPTNPTGDWVVELLVGVGEGGRDDACTRLAGYFLGKGVSVEAVEALLLAWADRCTPPFPADQVIKCVVSIAAREVGIGVDTPSQGAPELVDLAIALIKRPVRNVRKTGLAELDKLLDGGLEAGTVTLVGARPGVGKTALLLQIMREIGVAGAGVLFVTLEMSPTRLMRRVLSQASQVRFENLKTGDLTTGEWALLNIAAGELRTLPLHVHNKVHTVEALDGLLDSFPAGQIQTVMIDSLQKLGPPDGDGNPRAAAEHVIKALTKLAVRRDLPIIAASMLSRPDRSDKNWRPQMSNLRESAVLEHEADNILLLHREEGDQKLDAFLRKHRDGEVGEIVLAFNGPTLTVRGNS